jgi:hypothetical protein
MVSLLDLIKKFETKETCLTFLEGLRFPIGNELKDSFRTFSFLIVCLQPNGQAGAFSTMVCGLTPARKENL